MSMDTLTLINAIYEGHQLESTLSPKVTDLLIRSAAKAELLCEKNQQNPNGPETSVFTRIKLVKDCFDQDSVLALIAPYENYCEKSSDISVKLREKGNDLYKNRNVEGALRAYTLALAFAPGPNEALLAYTNRSAVLLQKNFNKEALVDIQRALTLVSQSHLKDIPIPNLMDKLKERMEKCQGTISKIQAKDNSCEDDEKHKENQRLLQNYFQVQNPNKTVPNVEHFIKFNYSKEKGRHLIVTRDVKAGNVLLLDSPFVSVLNKLLRWETEHCTNCSKIIVNGIPCQECTFALFCGESCRDTACSPLLLGKHHLEHKYLPILHSLDSSHSDLQILRILATVGPQSLLELMKSLTLPSISDQMRMPGFDKNGIYSASSYLPIYHLITHPPLQSFNGESFQNAMKALFLKTILKNYTPFFANIKALNFDDFIAGLILKHLESIKYNQISVSKLVKEKSANGGGGGGKGVTKSVAYAAAVYPVISLCNHSCDPNCAPVKQSKYLQTSLIALKHLKEGDELFITYKPLYTQMKCSERQRYLAERYRFICGCQACENNWGPDQYNSEMDKGPAGAMLILQPTRCEKCPRPPTGMEDGDEDKIGEDGKKIIKRQCHACCLKDLDRAKEIGEREQELFECHDLLEEGEYMECLKRLPEVVDFFGREGFQSYFPLYNVALDLFKRALVHSVTQLQL